jgi:hypothetical protein
MTTKTLSSTVNSILKGVKGGLKNALLWQVVILVMAFAFAAGPLLALCYIIYTMIGALAAHLAASETGIIDIGVPIGRPLARFRMKRHEMRLHLIPFGIMINGNEVNLINIFSSVALLLIGVFASTIAFWFDGWPQLLEKQTLPPPPYASEASGVHRPMTKIIEVAKSSGLRGSNLYS